MNRRRFMLSGGAAAAALCSPWAVNHRIQAAPAGYDGPYWIFLTASGGWDPRFLFDPSLDVDQNLMYTEVAKVGNISHGAWEVDLDAMGYTNNPTYVDSLISPGDFLTKHGSQLCVINGVDTETNNHDTGRKAAMTGSTGDGSPALGALIAAQHGMDRAIPFISSGGYDVTQNLVPLTRVGSASGLSKLAFPNLLDPTKPDGDSFHTQEGYDRIRKAQLDRLAELKSQQNLPRLKRSMGNLQTARLSDGELAQLQLPSEFATASIGGVRGLIQSNQLAVAAFKSRVAVCSSASLGGFDTHGNHDRDQRRQVSQILKAVSWTLDYLAAEGLADKTYVVVGSDFARGPRYNTGGGKDHWPVTSMMVFGPGIQGDRVLGGSDGNQLAQHINEENFDVTDSGGVKITPGLIHQALRQKAGIGEDLLSRFPLKDKTLNLFG